MTIHLNNNKISRKELKKIFKSIQDKKVLKAKGGFLFKSSLNDSEFHIGIIPVLLEGERSHHYDITLDFEDEYVFSGFFNVDGTLGILFTPPGKKEDIGAVFKEQLKNAYRGTATILIDNGFPEKMKLDWISQKILEEIGVYEEIPGNLCEIIL